MGAAEYFADGEQGAFVLLWPVYETYRVWGGIIYADGDALAPASRASNRPLENVGLFVSFANLAARGEPSERSALGWVHRYGLLTRDQHTGYPEPMSLADFQQESICAYELLLLYRNIRARDAEALRRRYTEPWFGAPRTAVQRYFAAFHPTPSKRSREWEQKSDALVIEMAVTAFESVLEDKLSDIHLSHRQYVPKMRITDRPAPEDPRAQVVEVELHPATRGRYAPERSYKCPDLRSAIYLQLDLAYMDQKPIGNCVACGMQFFATRKDKRHCGPTCRSNARHQRNRRR